EKSATVLKEKKVLESHLNRANALTAANADLQAALELAEEGEAKYIEEAQAILQRLEAEHKALEVQSLLGGELDTNPAILTINAGAGGTESCDWASMLMRMYMRYGERKGWSVEIYDIQEGDEAGIKSCTIGFEGDFAFGLLKAESGVHR